MYNYIYLKYGVTLGFFIFCGKHFNRLPILENYIFQWRHNHLYSHFEKKKHNPVLNILRYAVKIILYNFVQ